ncbi:MAG: hypothetical protein OYH76_01630 [Defluviicoccus sp.]|nr:hypothetical protein [Defluviicoccus sp.]MDE0274565.1 hypothetical protein [Defluviicoccus sp.]
MFNRFIIAAAIAFTLAACGGGGSGGDRNTVMRDDPSPQIPMVPSTDHGDTTATASSIALNEAFAGRIASATDADYFRLPVAAEGTLTITTTGNANPHIRVYDAAGVEIPGRPGSYTISITAAILAKGRYIFIEFYDGTAGETYFGSTELTPSSSLSLVDKLRLYTDGDPALYMTPAQMKQAALETLFATTHFVDVPGNFFFPDGIQPQGTAHEFAWSDIAPGVANSFRASSYRPVMNHNGVNVFTATSRFVNPEAEYTTSCVGAGCTPPPLVQYTALEDVTSLGGWMDHSYFQVNSVLSCDTANSGCSGSSPVYNSGSPDIYADALARASGTNPMGTGSATWAGIMTGISYDSNPDSVVRFLGDAQISIDDLTTPIVDVSFTNIHDIASAERHPDLMWNGLAVKDGQFGESHTEQVDLGNGGFQHETMEIGAAFSGPNHEEVVGTFSFGYIDSGAFGAKRQ